MAARLPRKRLVGTQPMWFSRATLAGASAIAMCTVLSTQIKGASIPRRLHSTFTLSVFPGFAKTPSCFSIGSAPVDKAEENVFIPSSMIPLLQSWR